jgi:hypothetical protein
MSAPGRPPPVRIRSQAGYLLLEALVVLGVMGSAVVAYMALQMVQTRIDQGKAIGGHYARINEGLGQYMTLHHVALKKLPPDCSVHGLASTTSKTRPATGTACNLMINGIPVSNGLQPSVEELVKLGFLPAATTGAMGLNALVTISEPNRNGAAASTNWTVARLLAVITQRCVAAQANNSLQGRYVLVRRPTTTDHLALDEIEVVVNGSNVASSAVLSASSAFNDGETNAAAYYSPINLVDRQLTRAPGIPYQAPGLFRSLAGANAGAWVQLDLGTQRDISSIGLRAVQGNTGTGATGNTWAAEGALLVVEINNASADSTGRFVSTTSSQIRQATPTGLVPGSMRYVSSEAFSSAAAVSLTPTAQGCPANTFMVLSSLLFNTQPYELPTWQGSGAMLATAMLTAGTEAVMSNPVKGGELESRLLSIANPLRYYDPDNPADITGIGVGGIIAVRNGYDSYSTSLQTRADGSNLPTAAWNFNQKNLTGVGNFESASANVRGDLTTQGALIANKATFNELKLPLASAGNACSSLTQSIAQTTDGQLLSCIGNSNQWKSALAGTVNAKEYYEIDISRGPNGSPFQALTKYCGNEFCNQNDANMFYVSDGKIITPLPTDQWFPVVGGYAITQPTGTAGNVVSSYFNVYDSQGNWHIATTGTTAAVKLTLRFYKINL